MSETVDALPLIADIGGYTRFMNLHRTSLAHAQENTSRLLGAIYSLGARLELRAGGRWAFLSDRAFRRGDRAPFAGLATAIHRAFHDRAAAPGAVADLLVRRLREPAADGQGRCSPRDVVLRRREAAPRWQAST